MEQLPEDSTWKYSQEANLALEFRRIVENSDADFLGHPARALVAISQLLGEQDRKVKAGSVVMLGSPMAAQPLAPGMHVLAEVEKLGRVEFTTV